MFPWSVCDAVVIHAACCAVARCLSTAVAVCAGIDLDPYSSSQWRRLAHATAALTSFEAVPLLTAGGAWEPAAASISAVRRWVLTQRRLAHERRVTRPQVEYLTAVGVCWLAAPGAAFVTQQAWDSMFRAVADAVGAEPPQTAEAEAAPAAIVTYVDAMAAGPDPSVGAAKGMNAGVLLRTLNSTVRTHAMEPAVSARRETGSAAERRAASVAALTVGGGSAGGVPGDAAGYAAHAACSPADLRDQGHGAEEAPASGRPAAAAKGRDRPGGGDGLVDNGSSDGGPAAASGWGWSAGIEFRRGGKRPGRRGRDGRWAASSSSSTRDSAAPAHGRGEGGGGGSSGYGAAALDKGPLAPAAHLDTGLLLRGDCSRVSSGGAVLRESEWAEGMQGGNVVADTLGEVAKVARQARSGEDWLTAVLAGTAVSFVAALDATAAGGGEAARMHAWTTLSCSSDSRFRHAVLADWVQQQHALCALGMQMDGRDAALRQVAAAVAAEQASGNRDECDAACAGHEEGDVDGGRGREYERLWCELSRPARDELCAGKGGLWQVRVAELIRYRRRHGTAEVPVLGQDEELATWTEGVRALRKALRPSQLAQAWALGVELRLPTAGAGDLQR